MASLEGHLFAHVDQENVHQIGTVVCWFVAMCRLEKTDKEANKQVYCQLLSRCCKELTAAQVKALPAHLRAAVEPKFEAYQEKKRMWVTILFFCES